jgi:hypothetical protein
MRKQILAAAAKLQGSSRQAMAEHDKKLQKSPDYMLN